MAQTVSTNGDVFKKSSTFKLSCQRRLVEAPVFKDFNETSSSLSSNNRDTEVSPEQLAQDCSMDCSDDGESSVSVTQVDALQRYLRIEQKSELRRMIHPDFVFCSTPTKRRRGRDSTSSIRG